MAKIDEFAHATTKSLRSVRLPRNPSNPSPYMMPNSESEPYESGDHLVLGSGKLVLLDKLLPKLFDEGHRVLLFSGFTSYTS
jgi:SNF2 family DNA or RNA helicase